MQLKSCLSFIAIGVAVCSATPLRYLVRDVTTEFPDPTVDPFYVAPANINTYKPGQVIRSRSVTTTITSDVGSSYQLFYRTTNTSNQAEGTVATVWAPTTPKSPAQVLSYHSYMDSTSPDCAVSWAFVQGSASNGKAVTSLDAPVFIEWALSQGIYVVDPDDEGPKAAFIAGFQQGMAALDGIRAIKNYYKLPASTGIAMTGYSGGASVTVWAANLAAGYAPDLNILGVAHGGTPIDSRNIFNFLNAGLFSGFAGAGLVGLMNAYDDLNAYILAHVSATAATQIAQYRSKNFCIGQVVATYPFTNFISEINVADPLDAPIPKKILARETLLMSSSSGGIVTVPKFPRLQWHALEDEIVPFADEQTFVTEQCAHGANIQFQIFPVAEHITAELLGIPGAIIFLGQIFAGTTPKVVCGTPLPGFVTSTSPGASSVLGENTVKSLLALNGTTIMGQTVKL
ncbi:hypothetical protein CBS101457_000967 [Exobasidium rhododendri]|nr:hypothetical protein CBS101457_000967 [Exobasidium rhododendri]